MDSYAALAATEREMGKTMIDQMVDRFLGWRLPYDFAPDGGISFTLISQDHPEWWPTGTCLFTAVQAKAMFEHCAAMPRIDVDAISRAQLQRAVETITRMTNAKNGWISHEDMRAAIGAALNA